MVWAGSFPMDVYISVQASTEAQPCFVTGARSKILPSGLVVEKVRTAWVR
jgi:hypothetical protein